ncbi:MAG TPA: hypothetical protein DCF68_17185 [Cyanothece sp. UBA12306]|nr:hypothetical protein [Cyanothece sp. UBA12306]
MQAKSVKEDLDNETVIQEKSKEQPNQTGLPDRLKTGVENLSGYSLDDVRVHYNSPKPAQLQAHAYTQGTDIHVAPGQEKHLPHEAWHVVQQMQGRVKPTMQMKGVQINDDQGLEKEANLRVYESIDSIPSKVVQRQEQDAEEEIERNWQKAREPGLSSTKYKKAHKKAIDKGDPIFSCEGYLFNTQSQEFVEYKDRKVRRYDDGTWVSAIPGKRISHGLKYGLGKFTSGTKATGRWMKKIPFMIMHPDIARKRGDLKHLGTIGKAAAIAVGAISPQVSKIMSSMIDTLTQESLPQIIIKGMQEGVQYLKPDS